MGIDKTRPFTCREAKPLREETFTSSHILDIKRGHQVAQTLEMAVHTHQWQTQAVRLLSCQLDIAKAARVSMAAGMSDSLLAVKEDLSSLFYVVDNWKHLVRDSPLPGEGHTVAKAM
eukprot:TRINITY_DN5572_c0_g1_i3.p2 TRINITY_DN5572_c0_g1~~TRINITY_DN5572_c0_g1_i3.p2  ORF type:complete len:117 (-),score=13.86 TRINITY_DN5572_c0_g1_i3:50-400(-)